jgi:hypothetical protein
MLNSWRSRVNEVELQACGEILDRFGMDLYGTESALPHHRALGRQAFGKTAELP